MKIAPFYKWLNIKLTSSHYSGWFGIVSYTVFFPGSLFEGNGAKPNEILFVCLLFMGMNNASWASITELISKTEGWWPQRRFFCCLLFTQVNFLSSKWLVSVLSFFVSPVHHSACAVIYFCSTRTPTKAYSRQLKELKCVFLRKKLPEEKLAEKPGDSDILFSCVIERHWQALLTAVIRIILHVSEILSVWEDRIYNTLYPLCFSSDPLEMCIQKIPCFVPWK